MNGLPFQNGPEMAITYFKENRGGGQAAGGGGGRGGHEGGGVGRGGIAAAAGARRTRGGGHPGQGQATGGGGGGINRYPLGTILLLLPIQPIHFHHFISQTRPCMPSHLAPA